MSENLTKLQRETFLWLETYINQHNHAPALRQIQTALELSSVAQVQSRLAALKRKGYINWEKGHARTLRILRPSQQRGVPLWGTIAASGWRQAFADQQEEVLPGIREVLRLPDDCFALRVRGDSMIESLIGDGDIVLLHPPADPDLVQNHTIVAARVGNETTLKHYHRTGTTIQLKPANPRYPIIHVDPTQHEFEIQGVYLAVVRSSNL
ncbi:MAG: transcriptional repressor LexA [Synechococcales bacterium]|nr:transcriptional repressor LexA [Synechococcales bacterium]